ITPATPVLLINPPVPRTAAIPSATSASIWRCCHFRSTKGIGSGLMGAAPGTGGKGDRLGRTGSTSSTARGGRPDAVRVGRAQATGGGTDPDLLGGDV